VIARINRFHGHKSVSRVRGATIHSSLFSIRYATSSRTDYRLAVVVSKKISLKAVIRNRIRRRLFETVRQQKRIQGLPLDLVIYAKSVELADVDQAVLAQEMASAIKKILRAQN